MATRFVIDNCSLVNFFRYYYFDKNHNNKINKVLIDFIVEKIELKEIIVIDKVFQELREDNNEIVEFKKAIKDLVIKTDSANMISEVNRLSNEYYRQEAEQYYHLSDGTPDYDLIDRMLQKSKDIDADLSLVAYCNYLKNGSESVMLLTEESFVKDKKIIEKIPTICHKEKIICNNLPHFLFDFYKDKLKFVLDVV